MQLDCTFHPVRHDVVTASWQVTVLLLIAKHQLLQMHAWNLHVNAFNVWRDVKWSEIYCTCYSVDIMRRLIWQLSNWVTPRACSENACVRTGISASTMQPLMQMQHIMWIQMSLQLILELHACTSVTMPAPAWLFCDYHKLSLRCHTTWQEWCNQKLISFFCTKCADVMSA